MWEQQCSKELKWGHKQVERTAGCADHDSRARGKCEQSRETKETAEIESNGCQSGIGVRPYYIDEGSWQADKTETLPERSKFVINNWQYLRQTASGLQCCARSYH